MKDAQVCTTTSGFSEHSVELKKFDERFDISYSYNTGASDVRISAGAYPVLLADYEGPKESWSKKMSVKFLLIGSIFFESEGNKATIFIKKNCPERLSLETSNNDVFLAELESTVSQTKTRFILFPAIPDPTLLINITNNASTVELDKIKKFHRVKCLS